MPSPTAGYRIDGVAVPSVTTVLKAASTMPSDALCGWAARLARDGLDWWEERERSGAIGTYIHGVIEAFPNPPEHDTAVNRYGKPLNLTAEERARADKAFHAHAQFVRESRPRIVVQEVQLVSPTLRVGGTPDMVADLDAGPHRGRYLLDHKTGKLLGMKEVMQAAAYSFMLHESLGIEVDGVLMMHHPDAAPFKVTPLTLDDLAKGLLAFRTTRILYDELAAIANIIPQPTRRIVAKRSSS